MVDALVSVTVCTIALASRAFALLTDAMAATSLSTMAVDTAPALPLIASDSKLPPVAVASVTLKLSAPSASASSIVATSNVVELEPARMVTVATPVKSLPSVAVPL